MLVLVERLCIESISGIEIAGSCSRRCLILAGMRQQISLMVSFT
jgi:hypothetical protein